MIINFFYFGFPVNIKINSYVIDNLLIIDHDVQFELYHDISLLIYW